MLFLPTKIQAIHKFNRFQAFLQGYVHTNRYKKETVGLFLHLTSPVEQYTSTVGGIVSVFTVPDARKPVSDFVTLLPTTLSRLSKLEPAVPSADGVPSGEVRV